MDRRRLVPLIALLMIPLVPTGTPAGVWDPVLFEETWDDGLAAWNTTGDGATGDCVTAAQGCSLRFDPPCCGTYATVQRDVALPLLNLTRIALLFRGSDLHGDTDTAATITLSQGGRLLVAMTEVITPNNGFGFSSEGFGSSIAFGRWPAANEWYQVLVYIDPVRDVAFVDVIKQDGTHVASSPVLGIPSESDTIDALSFHGVSWTQRRAFYHYDEIRIQPASHPEPRPARGLTAHAPAPGEIALTWLAPDYSGAGVAGYAVYRTGSNGTIHLGDTVERQYHDQGLPDGTTYAYQVRALGAGGHESLPTQPVSVRTLGPPAAVPSVRSDAGSDGNHVHWQGVRDDGGLPVQAYLVHRSAEDGAPVHVATMAPDARYWYDHGAPIGEPQRYHVHAVNELGAGPMRHSNLVTAGIPAGPVDFRAEAGDGSARLEWATPATPPDHPVLVYVVQREGPNGDSELFYVKDTTYNDTGLRNNMRYFYRVSAYNDIGQGYWTAWEEVVPQRVPGPPLALAAAALPGPRVMVTWLPPTENPDAVVAYRIYRTVDGVPWSRLGDVAKEILVFTDPAPVRGATNDYQIRPLFQETAGYYPRRAEGPASNMVSAFVPA